MYKDSASDPAFQKTLSSIRIASSDYQELVWLHAERENAEHEGKMMITANMNRLDQHFTEVPVSVIPSRTTNSAGVLYARALLRLVQEALKRFVQQSDEERIRHTAAMTIINGAPSPSDVQLSITQADAAAASRKAAIQQRAFRLPAGASVAQQACPQNP